MAGTAWLGEPIAIKDATAARFRRQSGANLLVVGQDEENALGMLIAGLLTLRAQHPADAMRGYLLDFGNADMPHAHLLHHAAGIMPGMKYGKRRQLAEFINEIAQEIERRAEHERLDKHASSYLFVYGLQRVKDFDKEDSFAYSSPPAFGLDEETPQKPTEKPGKLFAKILREGPDVGIHTLIWCDTNANLQRRLDRQAIKEFDMRVVFQISHDDSHYLIDSSAASKIGQHRALFYSEEEGRLEKFRPFALPNEEWLQRIGSELEKA